MTIRKNQTGRALAVTAALATVLSATAAQAAPAIRDMTLKPATTQFDNPPHLLMEHDGSKYKWANKGDVFHIKMRITGRGKGNRLHGGNIRIAYNGTRTIWGWPASYKTWKIDQVASASLGKMELGLFEDHAIRTCNRDGGNSKVVKNLAIPLRYQLYSQGATKSTKGTYPGRVVCMAKKNGPTRVPSRSSQSRDTGLQVKKVKLYTIPARPACGKPVRLVTEIWTNRPGKVNFQLFRKDGNKQNASLTTNKVNGGFAARWAKSYTFKKSVSRNYMVVVKGHIFSTSWVPMKLNCGAGADHGVTGNLRVGQNPRN